MKIATKFNIGETVWILLKEVDYESDEELEAEIGGRIGIPIPTEAIITDVDVHFYGNGTAKINYSLDSTVGEDYFTRPQDEVFKTMNDLLEYVALQMGYALTAHNATLENKAKNGTNKD